MVRDGSAPRVSTAGDGLCLGAAPHFRRGSLWQAVLEQKAEGLASAFLPGCCKKVWDQSSRLALHPRPRRPLIPSTPAQRLGVLFAHSPSHVSFPSMAAAPVRAASVSRDCSAFTCVAACTLARSPIRDPLSEGFSLYNTKEDISPCPLCMRNTMLSVAALLHLEATRIEASGVGRARETDCALARHRTSGAQSP